MSPRQVGRRACLVEVTQTRWKYDCIMCSFSPFHVLNCSIPFLTILSMSLLPIQKYEQRFCKESCKPSCCLIKVLVDELNKCVLDL
jgi:hypothetical protein